MEYWLFVIAVVIFTTTATVTDLSTRKLPNWLTVSAFAAAIVFHTLTGGLGFMDMQPTLTAAPLFEQIRTYSDATVNFYIGWSLFDFAWPFITFTTMCFISAWLINFLSESWREKLWLLVGSAYATVLLDWLENTGFIWLVLALPEEPMWLAQTTLAFHAGKLFFNMVFNLGFWVLLISVIIGAIRKRLTN